MWGAILITVTAPLFAEIAITVLFLSITISYAAVIVIALKSSINNSTYEHVYSLYSI